MTRGVAHPEKSDLRCEIVRVPNHPECTGWNQATQQYEDWPNPDYVAPKKVRGGKAAARGPLAAAARRVQPAPTVGPLEGFPAGLEGSERAASRWTEDEVAMVDAAIRAVAERHRGGGEFTSDEIWAELNGTVPVTKALTSRLMRASRDGLIDNTGKIQISRRGGHHDHGQRLTIWYSLLA